VRFAVALLFLLVCAKTVRDRRLIVMLQLLSLAMGAAIEIDTNPGVLPLFQARFRGRWEMASVRSYLHWPTAWHDLGGKRSERAR
jgi:hypothetical protein